MPQIFRTPEILDYSRRLDVHSQSGPKRSNDPIFYDKKHKVPPDMVVQPGARYWLLGRLPINYVFDYYDIGKRMDQIREKAVRKFKIAFDEVELHDLGSDFLVVQRYQ